MTPDSEFHSQIPCRVLLVGTAPSVLAALRETLAGVGGIELHQLEEAQAAERAAALEPAVVVRALGAGEDGCAFIRSCRADQALKELPLLVLAPQADDAARDAAFAAGASDYLDYQPARTELLARLRYHAAANLARQQCEVALRLLRENQEALARAHAELDLLAGLDGLTGIPGRRRFEHVAQTEWQRARRSGQPLSVLICDLDHFEEYNQHFGRLAGDLCLKKLAGVLTGQLKRPSDLAARYGAERFAIVLPDTGLDGAVRVAEACRHSLEHLGLSHPSPERRVVTMSIGVAASVPAGDDTLETLLARADEALQAARARGRNRVMALRG